MSNLATLAASFTSLDAQKNSINEALSELQALNDSKVVGQLSFVVSSVHGDATDVVDLAVTPSEANLSLSKLKNLGVGKCTELQLTSKYVTISISCSVTADGNDLVYEGSFEVKDVGDNESMVTEVELLSNESKILKVQVKATYDTLAGLMKSKQKELQEVEQAKAEVVEEIKVLKSKPEQKKEKRGKKTKQERVTDTAAAFDVDEEEPSAISNAMNTLTNAVASGVQVALTHRAVVLFGAAAWAISAFGENASV